ncbi:MAG: hypothetical protein WCJ95_21450 [Mariniphaga sp.]
MIKNRAGPWRGHARGDPRLMHKPRGDPGMYRHARDNPTCNLLYFYVLVNF